MNSMKFFINDLLNITSGKLIINNDSSEQYSISTDTRTITNENIFLPIVGTNFDGHDFINVAIDKGCKCFFVDKSHSNKIELSNINANIAIEVDDTLEAYLKIARFARRKINPKVIAITGSSGKTTTKEILTESLSARYKTHKSKLNHNNEMGLCQTILSMPDNTEFLVVEMGMRGSGEIELLSKHAEPDFVIITNIGAAHIGRLGSIENIAKAKCEIVKYLNKSGVLIAHDDQLIKDYSEWQGKTIYYSLFDKDLKILENKAEYSKFIYKENEYQLGVSGEHNILNSLAAIEVALIVGMTPSEISSGLLNYRHIDNRWQVTDLPENKKLINDSYNANPDSVKASINAVTGAYPEFKTYLVLGDMEELGEYEDKLHAEIGKFINNKNIYELITVGNKAKLIANAVTKKEIKINTFTRNDEVVKYLIENFNDNSIALIKASRSMRFHSIVESLINKIQGV